MSFEKTGNIEPFILLVATTFGFGSDFPMGSNCASSASAKAKK
jgi:hypothetical protein